MFPLLILTNLQGVAWSEGYWKDFIDWAHEVFHRGGFIYNILYLVMIYFFCYFWTAITFNPKDMAENLKNFGSFIPGYRPGKTHRRLPRKSDGPDHVRRGRVPGGGGDHPHADYPRSST